MALPTAALYSPTPSLEVDGQDRPALAASILALSVAEDLQGMRRLELTLGNWGEVGRGLGFTLSDGEVVDLGRRLRCTIGGGERRGEVFDGAITGIEEQYPSAHPPRLVVLAEDRLQDLRMTRRTRTFSDVTDADVLRRIAADHGLRAEVDVDGVRHPVLAQLAVSDLAFLRERARAVDAELWISGDTLHLQARTRRAAGEVELRYGADLARFTVLADLAHQRTTVSVTGWDVAAKQPIEQTAGASVIQGELDGGTGGASILERAFGARCERIVDATPVGTEEARALAQAHFRARARRFLTGRGEAEGDARLRVGGTVLLHGLSARCSGRYHLTETHHRYDTAVGYRTGFHVERAGIGAGR